MNDHKTVEQKVDAIYQCLFGIEGDGGMVKKIDSISEQTKKTNGRVNKLELWKNYITGGLAVITCVALPICWTIWSDVKSDNQMITAHVAQSIIK